MIRPRAARWFEALVARDDCTLLLEALAATGCVELEVRAGVRLPAGWGELQPALQRFADFRRRYGAWWPQSGLQSARMPEQPAYTLARGNAVLEGWAREAEPAIRELEALAGERAERQRWRGLLQAMAAAGLDAGALARAGPLAGAIVIECAEGKPVEVANGPALVCELEAAPRFAVIVGTPEVLESAIHDAIATQGRVHRVPAWVGVDCERDAGAIAARLAAIEARCTELAERLAACAERHGLRQVLADLLRVQWVFDNVHALEAGERFAWVTGWSSDLEGTQLAGTVSASGARALLHFAPPPAELRAPLLLVNPRWARAFELFPRALGVPGQDEADPTVLLALVVPLLFGYMFGDVGQGLVIAVAAWWLRERIPVARLLFAGGVCSCAFGLLFGSVFSVHGVLVPLWIDPLAAPVQVLAVPLLAGALLLGCGLLLQALGSLWRGEMARLLGEDLGLIAVYAGLLGCVQDSRAAWLAAAGVCAYLAGSALHAGRAAAAIGGLGQLVERTLQLLINTLSFTRVGAFALAHAGLSSAVAALAGQFESGGARLAVFVTGNLLIMTLETLVVSVQATRLVLFEFFARFLTGVGRPFRPLPPPPSLVQE